MKKKKKKRAPSPTHLGLFNWLYEHKAHVMRKSDRGSNYHVERIDVPRQLQGSIEHLVQLGVVIKHYKQFRWMQQGKYRDQKICCLQLVLDCPWPAQVVALGSNEYINLIPYQESLPMLVTRGDESQEVVCYNGQTSMLAARDLHELAQFLNKPKVASRVEDTFNGSTFPPGSAFGEFVIGPGPFNEKVTNHLRDVLEDKRFFALEQDPLAYYVGGVDPIDENAPLHFSGADIRHEVKTGHVYNPKDNQFTFEGILASIEKASKLGRENAMYAIGQALAQAKATPIVISFDELTGRPRLDPIPTGTGRASVRMKLTPESYKPIIDRLNITSIVKHILHMYGIDWDEKLENISEERINNMREELGDEVTQAVLEQVVLREKDLKATHLVAAPLGQKVDNPANVGCNNFTYAPGQQEAERRLREASGLDLNTIRFSE